MGLVGTAAVIGVTLSSGRATSMLQIIPVMGGNGMLSHYSTWVPYAEPENVGMYQYQAAAEPMGQMGTNTAFIGTHDGMSLLSSDLFSSTDLSNKPAVTAQPRITKVFAVKLTPYLTQVLTWAGRLRAECRQG